MIVEIKKTKLTKSIISQISLASCKDLESSQFEVIGWCVNKGKWIILYNPITNELRKYYFITDILRGFNEKKFYVNVKFGTLYVSVTYTSKDENENNIFFVKITAIKLAAEEKGQFFI